jgi:hypothetical protein
MTAVLKPLRNRNVGASSLLWHKIDSYEIDGPTSQQKFSDRLAKEMLWSKDYTLRVIEEYKRFMFLAAVGKDPVTPSIEVDEAWHLHMLYTRDYQEFCNILGKFIHHGPGRGGKEDEKFIDWYYQTKRNYFMWFSEEPPEDIWPSSEVRFRHVHFAKVDLLKHWVIPAGDWKGLCKCMWQFIKWKIKHLW